MRSLKELFRPTAIDAGRLDARPTNRHESQDIEPGLHELGLRGHRDALLYVPRSFNPNRPAPLIVTMHGAGSSAKRGFRWFVGLSERTGVLLLSPASLDRTWDLVVGSFGEDVRFIDDALEWTFERFAIDRDRLALQGFSDGATYALSLGLTNGDLFSHVIAFSPGFMDPGDEVGDPRVFVSHGTEDSVLPIEMTSRQIVPELEMKGYEVRYTEFDGGHFAPRRVSTGAMSWFLHTRPKS